MVDHLEGLWYTGPQPYAPVGVLVCEIEDEETVGASEVVRLSEWTDEAALIEQAKTDPQAFGVLYERYLDKIYHYVYYRTGNHHDAEDLTAKVFHQAMDHLPGYVQRGAPFSSWLYRIAHNLVANWHRDRSRRTLVTLDRATMVGAQKGEGLLDQVVQSQRNEALLEAVRCLPADRQMLLILKFVERLPNAEIGEIMGRSEGAIKSLYHRTLSALRDLLDDQTL